MTGTILGIIASILALAISLFAYYTSDKTKIKQLKARQYELEEKLRMALAKLDRVRKKLSDFNAR
jgi:uncharacterized membrane protein (DUF106 family)